jgi:formate transporter
VSEPIDQPNALDALLPPAMATKAERVGVTKSQLAVMPTFVLAVLAGAFISLGALFATVATAGTGLDFGVSRVLGGVAFSLGLILVIAAGAELFTGNALIVMAWAGRKVSAAALLRNWGIVYVGNIVGAVATALIVVWSGHLELGGGAVGDNAMAIADAKVDLAWGEALLRGVLANALVCLAVWLSFAARSLTDRVFAIVFPVTAFVAAGFEHSIANLYFVPAAILARQAEGLGYWDVAATAPDDHADLTWSQFLTANLVPVTIGNILGGAGLVALVYWFVYLRPERP